MGWGGGRPGKSYKMSAGRIVEVNECPHLLRIQYYTTSLICGHFCYRS